jgi:hypothetical protein
MKRYKSPGNDRILAELIQARGEILQSKIHNSLILSGIRKDCLNQRKESVVVPVYKKAIRLTAVIIGGYHCYQLHTTFYTIFFSPYTDEIIGNHQYGFRRNKSTTDMIFFIRPIPEKELEKIVV